MLDSAGKVELVTVGLHDGKASALYSQMPSANPLNPDSEEVNVKLQCHVRQANHEYKDQRPAEHSQDVIASSSTIYYKTTPPDMRESVIHPIGAFTVHNYPSLQPWTLHKR